MNELHCDVIQAAFDLYLLKRDLEAGRPVAHEAADAYKTLMHAIEAVEERAGGHLVAPTAPNPAFAIVEQIQDGRPRVTGPLDWAQAEHAAKGYNRTICDFGGLLP